MILALLPGFLLHPILRLIKPAHSHHSIHVIYNVKVRLAFNLFGRRQNRKKKQDIT
jgi:hypothetical protein